MFKGRDAVTKTEGRQLLRAAGASRDGADDLIRRLLFEKRLEAFTPKTRHAPTYIGSPEAVEVVRQRSTPCTP